MTTAPHDPSSVSNPRPARKPREIHVDLEARETAWEISRNRTVSAWATRAPSRGRRSSPMLATRSSRTYLKAQIERLSFGPEPADRSGGGRPSPAGEEQQSRLAAGGFFSVRGG